MKNALFKRDQLADKMKDMEKDMQGLIDENEELEMKLQGNFGKKGTSFENSSQTHEHWKMVS